MNSLGKNINVNFLHSKNKKTFLSTKHSNGKLTIDGPQGNDVNLIIDENNLKGAINLVLPIKEGTIPVIYENTLTVPILEAVNMNIDTLTAKK